MSTKEQIRKLFELDDKSDNELISELASLCSIYSMTSDNLKFKWEAFALNSGCSLKPTLPYIRHLKNSLQREFERNLKSRRTIKGRVITKRSNTMDLSEYGIANDSQEDSVENFMSNLLNNSTAKQHKVVPISPSVETNVTKISSATSQFLTRKTAHTIESQYNAHLPLRGEHGGEPISFQFIQDQIKPYRFMFEKLKERAFTLNERLEYMGSVIAEANGIEVYGNPTRPNQEPICAYGRVFPDATEGRMNDKSVMVQASIDLAMGRCIKLDLSHVDSYSLFPGQIIGFRGTNNNGDVFHVEELFMPSMPNKLELNSQSNSKPVELIVAAGPFTLDEDFSFQPLEELLNKCNELKPDIILLMGPFISDKHPKIIESIPKVFFQEQIIRRLEHVLEVNQHTQVFLMPSARDCIQNYSLFPQPPMSELDAKHPRLHFISNPSSININGHNISIANIDSLFAMAKQEITKSSTHKDRFTTLIQHILQQRILYPLLPTESGDIIDSSKMVDIQLPWKPDILIMPSQFKQFTKVTRKNNYSCNFFN
ncbi:MAG: DNA polymerase alpha/epsilon subunit B-domain-containing protein [Benjaminiella poitrasii]|nr:MAG: DNA polymerase alpha/epsilon subunit B-domain-containing protein [Benjaminiella poitrasii]